jgi:hypothetical protein
VARPCSSSAQISPSSTQSGVFSAAAIAFAIVGNRSVRSLSLRLVNVTSPCDTRAIAR